jgi:DNA-binding SARP family transcriptional activator
LIEQCATADELAALLSGAATLSRAGNRTAAIAALVSAVGLAPDDLTAHRRLAAAYAVAGDCVSARGEYDRFIERLESEGSLDAAGVERSYAAALLAPRSIAPLAIAAPAQRRLTTDQTFALRRLGVAIIAIAATVTAMVAAGAQIFASGGPL